MQSTDNSNKSWIVVCPVDDLVASSGVCALVAGEQVALFYLPEETPALYAIGNWDPIGEANVLSRGIVSDVEGRLTVASPLYKQHFDLLTGECLEQPDTSVPIYDAVIHEGMVKIRQPITETTCAYCGVGCGVDARVAAGEITAVTGTESHPANWGRLCVKGSALHETNSPENRLLHPEVDGLRASWDMALDKVAKGFKQVVEQHGPDAVAFYLSGQLLTEDYYVANKLMKGFMGSSNVDTNSRLCMSSAVAAYQRAFGADAVPGNYEDLEQADLLVFTGSNAAWTHPVLFQRIAEARQRRAHSNREMRVVVIDPRRTATCDIADMHLPILPGTDGFLFSGLLCWLHNQGIADQTYISNHTRGFGAALAAAAQWDVAATAKRCGISETLLTEFYSLFARTRRTVTFYSQGINQSSSGTDKCNVIINCHLATGRIGEPGMGPFSITGQPNAMGGREVGGLANLLAAHMHFANDADIDRVSRFWGAPNIARKPGLKAVDLFDAIEQGRIKAVWIMATNPAVSLPDADRVRRALDQCELVVVSDCVRHTDTAACANILLPATGWGEKNGTVTNSERRISRQRALVAAPGEARDDWWIITQVAQRMGYGEAFTYQHPADIFVEHAALSAFENNDTRAFNIGALANINRESYDNLKPVQWPVPVNKPEGTPRLFTDQKFYTPDQRAQFIPVMPKPARVAVDKTYPFVLNTGRIRDQWHTMTRTGKAARLMSHLSEPFIALNPKDMADLDLKENELARIRNSNGHYQAPVCADEGLLPGQIFAPIHWNDQFAANARVGALINPITDPHSGQPEFKQVPVSLELVSVVNRAVLITRNPISVNGLDYWARVTIPGGYRYELAAEKPLDWPAWFGSLYSDEAAPARYVNKKTGESRFVFVEDGKIEALLLVADRAKALPDRSWLSDLLTEYSETITDTHTFLRDITENASKGAIICVCHQVGSHQITQAIEAGACTVTELGQQLACGTNCGSCIPELKQLLNSSRRADAA